MCGIFGILHHQHDTVPDKSKLEKTALLLEHRGPDSYGIHADTGIGLVHTRLSLLDLQARSNQPFWDPQGRYALVYNGEIYNFKEMRERLERRGHTFRTTSDTETLLQCLMTDGVEETLPTLEGMFSFTLYDKLEQTLTLVRDQFGMKPLFICDTNEVFLFSSEIQAMRPWLTFTPDKLSISSFLFGFGGPTKGHTFFHNIRSLSPGTILRIKAGHASHTSPFFSMTDFWDQTQANRLQNLKPKNLVDEIEELLLESVRKQLLVADVPVGALCSGGVDSSLIMAMAATFHKNLAIFHANIVGPNSELEAATRLAEHLWLELNTVNVHDQDFIDSMPDVIEHFGHPYYECPQSIPILLVSRLIHSHRIKAVLSGEGSDECYLGYNWVVPNIQQWRHYIKDISKRLLRFTGATLSSRQNRNINIHELILGLHNRFEVNLENDEIDELKQLTNCTTLHNSTTKSLKLLNYGLRGLLHRNDSMGMAASVESRFPFLDTKLVQLAVNVPYKHKVRFSPTTLDTNHLFFCDKWILREVAKRYLPPDLSHRSKRPFSVDAYRRSKISSDFFDKSFVSELFGLSSRERTYLADHISGSPTLKTKLIQLEVWAHIFLKNDSKESILNTLQRNISVTAV